MAALPFSSSSGLISWADSDSLCEGCEQGSDPQHDHATDHILFTCSDLWPLSLDYQRPPTGTAGSLLISVCVCIHECFDISKCIIYNRQKDFNPQIKYLFERKMAVVDTTWLIAQFPVKLWIQWMKTLFFQHEIIITGFKWEIKKLRFYQIKHMTICCRCFSIKSTLVFFSKFNDDEFNCFQHEHWLFLKLMLW